MVGPAQRRGQQPLSEPAAARLGACTTPGARPDAVVVNVGAGTIDVIAPAGEVVAAGAGDLLTVAVAETLGVPRAAADWVKRGRASGSTRACGSRPRTAAAGSWTARPTPPPPACSPPPAPLDGCRSTGGTARLNGGPSGCA